jgi:transcriptional regulator with XRE-family HTH domain
MSVTLRTPADLGRALRDLREQRKLTTVELARRSGRSRDLIYRMESGRDVSSSALFDILRALDSSIEIRPAGLPTLQEMRERFKEPE